MSRMTACIALAGWVLLVGCDQGEGGGSVYICEDGELQNWWCSEKIDWDQCKVKLVCADSAEQEWFCSADKTGDRMSPTYQEACQGQHVCLDGLNLYWACETETAREQCEGLYLCVDEDSQAWSCDSAELANECDRAVAPQGCSVFDVACQNLYKWGGYSAGVFVGNVNQCNPVRCTPW